MLSILPITEEWEEIERAYGGLINHFWSMARAGCDTEPSRDWSIFTMLRDGDGTIEIDRCIAGALSEEEAKMLVNQHNATVVSSLCMMPAQPLTDAAPYLLEAVEEMLEAYEEGHRVQPYKIRKMCRDARDRARGIVD